MDEPRTIPGDWYLIQFQLAPGYDHAAALDVVEQLDAHPAVDVRIFAPVDLSEVAGKKTR